MQAIHFTDFDHIEHVNGVFTKPTLTELERMDERIGAIRDELTAQGKLDNTYFIVTSDHGFTNITRFIAPRVLLKSQDILAQGDAWTVATYQAPGVFAIYVNPRLPPTLRPRIQRKLQNIFDYLKSDVDFGIRRVIVGPDAVRDAGLNGFPGAYAVLEAQDGIVFSENETGPLVMGPESAPTYRATHGYPPQDSEMKTVFM